MKRLCSILIILVLISCVHRKEENSLIKIVDTVKSKYLEEISITAYYVDDSIVHVGISYDKEGIWLKTIVLSSYDVMDNFDLLFNNGVVKGHIKALFLKRKVVLKGNFTWYINGRKGSYNGVLCEWKVQ